MKLLVPVLINIFLVIVIYLLDKRTPFQKLPYWMKQIIIGLVFGGMSAFASGYGVELLGTVVNVRDAAPLSAGLIFGGPAGIIAGLIGGMYRWVSVAWGAGMYTRVACTIATILAGFLAAGLRRLMFERKKPTWIYGVCIAVVCEVIHMLLIFLTNINDASQAFGFVKGASIPMIVGNATAVGTAVFIVTLLSHEKIRRRKNGEQIAQTFQRWLLASIVLAYALASLCTFSLQNNMSRIETESVIAIALQDAKQDIKDASNENLLELAEEVKADYEKNPVEKPAQLVSLAFDHNVSEINIVDENGIIVTSSRVDFLGYDMASGEQSAEFLEVLKEQESYVQSYQASSYDETVYKKYAAIRLEEGGFLQVGYDAVKFQTDIRERVINATKNRHVGQSGFLIVCNESLRILSDGEYAGVNLKETSQDFSTEKYLEGEMYQTEIGGEPYLFSYTTTEGFLIFGVMPFTEAMFMRDASMYISIFMQTLIFAILFVCIYFLIKKVIINNLLKINSKLAEITNGNLDVTVDVRSNAEFASLSDDINSTVDTLKNYIAEAAARIDKELEYAKQIQLSALPTNYPDNAEYSIYAQMIAAKEVGGDFYDFYKLDDRTVAFLAADVSGKGIPAAMFMMTAKTILKDLAERRMPVNDIFTKANEKLCENNESGMFVTAWMGILNLDTGKLQYANAGHNPPLICHKDTEFEYLKSRAGFVLGGMEGIRYRMNELDLQPGDRIFLYTDGVTEATDSNEELYGEERLKAYMNQNKKVNAAHLLPALKYHIDEFVGEAPQFDDITMLMLDYRNEMGGVSMIEKVFPARDEALADVLGFVESTLEEYQCSMKMTMAICVAIEEVFVNVAHYAYGEGTGDVIMRIGLEPEDKRMIFEMIDGGIPFDPLAKPDPDITLSAEEREIGGLGIFITKKTMDTVSYRYEEEKNILTMTKKM